MNMRGHEAVRRNSYVRFAPRGFHEIGEGFIILATIEQHALSRASIARVIHVSTRGESSPSCHGRNRHRNRVAMIRREARETDPIRSQTPANTNWRRVGV